MNKQLTPCDRLIQVNTKEKVLLGLRKWWPGPPNEFKITVIRGIISGLRKLTTQYGAAYYKFDSIVMIIVTTIKREPYMSSPLHCSSS